MAGLILDPDPSRVMEGLRDTGYDFNTAMADLVDNSIAANATKIDVQIQMDPNSEVVVYIADNGCGMDRNGLINAMRYGSKRRDNASSLGKFGLGLKTASTAFCRCLSLISKDKEDAEYHKFQWDLDEVCKRNQWELLEPEINEDEIDVLEETTEGGSGTLVVWQKVDRLMKIYKQDTSRDKAFKRIIDKLKEHFAMVYQRFLDKKFDCQYIEITVNGDKVEPWDPFCTSEEATKELAEENIKVDLPNDEQTSFHVKAYLLPRVEEFSSSAAKSNARISNDLEGFYVYRENRLIYHGGWLGMFTSDPHISLLRVSFSFDHTLDEAFKIDIKKSRILLNEDIFEYLLKHFIPGPKREAENIYRKGRNSAVSGKSKGAHDSSNNNIEDKAKTVEGAKVNVLDTNSNTVQIQNSNGVFTGHIKIQTTANEPGQYRVIPVNDVENGTLWEPRIVEGKQAVAINQSHEYYQKVYAPIIKNSVIVTGMDSLLWALAEAEISTYNDDVKEEYEDMRIQVSRILKKLVKDLPDPDVEV